MKSINLSVRNWLPRGTFKAIASLALFCHISGVALADVPAISTQGNKLLFNGQQGSISGNSLFWSNNGWGGEKYYSAGTVNWLKSDWNAGLVRAAMGVEESGGYLQDRAGNKNKVKTVVDAAIAKDMYVIIDWHTHHAENYRQDAIDFFREMAQTYGNKNHVIYEIYNEPLGVSWSGVIKPYATEVIKAIRAVDPDNLIIVGTPNWSQDVDAAANDPITGYSNIAYTLHFYANGHRQGLRDRASYALSRGLPLFVTEWGSVEPSGNGAVDYSETAAWVGFMKANHISNANWSINDKAEGASALTGGASGNGGWANNQLTASGANAKDIIRNWPPLANVPPKECAAVILPARVEAESYCAMSGVQTESTTDAGGGLNVGWLDPNDSMTYKINVPSAGNYKISYRVASKAGGGAFALGAANSVNVPQTGDWQVWTTVQQTVALSAGVQDIKLSVINGGFNINWIELAQDSPPASSSSSAPNTGSSSSASSQASGSVKPLRIQGNKILMGDAPANFAGVSLFWSNNGWGGSDYYNANVVNWVKKDWNAKLVRAAMGVEQGGGYLEDPAANRARVKAVVDAAIANNMYVIIDWHTHHAEDYKAQAISFFQEMARTYGTYPNVIYEVYNEPEAPDNANYWSSVIKPYATDVIDAIRAIDPDNLITVGTRVWSQRVDEAARDPIVGRGNISYTLHFYVGAHGQSLRDTAQQALNMGAPLFVTEWGIWPPAWGFLPPRPDNQYIDQLSGAELAEVNAWKDFMVRNGIPNAGWAVAHKAEPSSYLYEGASTQGGWSDNQLTGSGKVVRDMIREINGSIIEPECNAVVIPAKVEVENHCTQSGIQFENSADVGGGRNAGWTDAGDFLTFKINVPAAGSYTASYRVASMSGGGILQIASEQGAAFGSVDVNATNGWQNWTTVSHQVQLSEGEQIIKLQVLAGGFNLNWFEIKPNSIPSSSSSSSSSSRSSSSSVSSTPSINKLVQAESWEVMQGVQSEATSDTGGGQNVGWTDAGDWISYGNAANRIDVPKDGVYKVEFRVASQSGGGAFVFEKNGGTAQYATVNVPNTGGWQTWTTVTVNVNLKAGNQGFGIAVKSGGWNINWFRVSSVN